MSKRGDVGETKTVNSLRTIPMPGYLLPQLKRWKLECPVSAGSLVFPGEPDGNGQRGDIDADKLLRNVLRRALRKAGLSELRFHDLRHLAASFMVEAGVNVKRAQEILGHASERTTLAIYTHTLRRQHDDTADKIGSPGRAHDAVERSGNNRETIDDAKPEEAGVSDCWIGSPGRTRKLRESG